MWLDTIHGTIDRRLLLNYRIDPGVLASILPAPFRPKTYQGFGMGGICMIRFRNLRPRFVPFLFGLSSENAAHRFAVEWEQDGELKEGVFIPRRDTNSAFNHKYGGKAFPGIFNRSKFNVDEGYDSFSIEIVREDGEEEASVETKLSALLPPGSIFPDLPTAANFFSLGAVGYSATGEEGHFHGMELLSHDWSILPLQVAHLYSRYFSDTTRFPAGSIEFDSALIMRKIPNEWHSRPDLFLTPDGKSLTARPPSAV